MDALWKQVSSIPAATSAADEGKVQGTPGSSSAPTPSSPANLPVEHLMLEFQVQSQFRLLWAVFQSHSTAEDEMIWPALKEKARSSGGKVRSSRCPAPRGAIIGACCGPDPECMAWRGCSVDS